MILAVVHTQCSAQLFKHGMLAREHRSDGGVAIRNHHFLV